MTSEHVATGDDAGGRKSVLHCANCGHDSLVNGDWVLHERHGSQSIWYQCPECGHSVSTRPIDSLDNSRFPSPLSPTGQRTAFEFPTTDTGSALWKNFWESYRDVATAWLSPWGDDCEAKAD
ncbi:hypothetical protein [Halorhabdus sp. SVX81]|uniref:hypothetical protein n=1 Tax=Halorhabdus sp. SVX81 TaxID=2978283 RepID=UPI0023D9DABB|nr:hypothetical protein [Halorhabdus sp. SVX81]